MDTSQESRPSPADGARGGGPARAVWFSRPKIVEIRQEDLPALGAGDIQVRTERSAISHGTEMLVYRGQVDPSLAFDLPTLRGSFAFPVKFGYASTGRIEALGSAVRTLAVGDRVFVHHPHQSAFVVPATSAVRLPDTMDAETGVLLANTETAVNILLDAHPRLGERVVIFGQGVVGLLVTQLLRRAGVGMLIAVDPVARRRDLALRCGAHHTFPPGDGLRDEVWQLTSGAGADLAIELSGNASALGEAVACVGFQGTVVAGSWYGTKPVTIGLGGNFHRGRVRLISSQVSTIDPALSPRWTMARRTELARTLLGELETTALITHRVPIERASSAYELIDTAPDDVVQVVFTYV